ncbi:hypothetical protein KM800_13895 [Clostridium tyrobutyricum]|uniref:hypothetical protein n=1 Tax=Clostridium tyrobutyricum TaxID=1519 RepID=UPI001C380640|nr:hypothetical protein [Clostridium tyrobutyricum]MBV4420399.1 hypothetical protein [Clostridium tyrobutyricum]
MSSDIVITSIVCVTIVGIVCIFAILAYFKDNAIFRYKNSSKDKSNEISITVDNDKDKNSKN